MCIVSENSEADIARNTAMSKVDWAVRELTANLIRVTRGAGRPHYIGRHAQALIDALLEYRNAAGHFPSSEDLSNALAIDVDPAIVEQMDDDNYTEMCARHSIIGGSLQIAASRLLGQKTQERAGEHQMYRGVDQRDALRAKRRKAARTAETKSLARRVFSELNWPSSEDKKPKGRS